LCLKPNVVSIYFYKQIFSLKQFHKAIVNSWFNLNIGILDREQPDKLPHRAHQTSTNASQRNQRELQLARSGNELQITSLID